MNHWEALELFEREGAVQRGHYLLSSGLHSDTYVQCARVLQHPHLSESLADELARGFDPSTIDLVLSPALGGIIIGYMVAMALNKRMVFSERAGGRMILRRGLSIEGGERVLIVEDVITTGGSVAELVELVEGVGASVAGVGALIERGEDRELAFTKKVLLRMDAAAWEESECPLCREGVRIEEPGSRRLG
jgi:orotate phosphoribosyltransferase